MKPEPLVEAIEAVAGAKGPRRRAHVALLTPQEAQRLHEALVDLNEAYLGKSAGALEMLTPLLAAFPEDLRLQRRAAPRESRPRSNPLAGSAPRPSLA